MNTTLVIREKGVSKNSALAKSEHELYEAMSGQFESFYSIGVILNRIMVHEEFKDAGYTSFTKYMNERQPCGIKARHAYETIAAMKIRERLPALCASSAQGEQDGWSESTIRPLLHKEFSPADQSRIAKKIATRVKNGDRFTAALVKSICDADRGVDRVKEKKKAAEIAEALTPAEVIDKLWGELLVWKDSLGNVPGDFWKDAESEDAGCCKKVSAVCLELASFLETKVSRKAMRNASSN